MIESGSGVLTVLDVDYSSASDACLSDAVFADGNLNNVNNIVLGDC